ncbi:MAG: thioredoxin family protein [Halobacteriota archaeon]
MKKQIGLITLIALLLTFVAFSGVASAQTGNGNVQMVMFTQKYCETCQKVHPIAQAAAAKYGVKFIEYDLGDVTNQGIAKANGVTMTPTIIMSGAQPARFEGDVSQAQLEAALQAAIGNPTAASAPTATPTMKPTTVPTATPTMKPTATPTMKPTATPTMKPTATPTMKPTTVPTATVQQPNIQVLQPQTQNQTTATQTVPEFSLLGLGAPALVIGAIYLFMRRK